METKTLTITNFSGKLTRYNDGDINSGLAKYSTTFGNDPFASPGNLTWFENPSQIDPDGSVITDLIVAARPRIESGVTYVYAIGHTGRLYKIQVNDVASRDPNYDNPTLLATLSSNSPTFKYGSSINFFGSTERIFIGHDVGVTRIDFDGANETFVGAAGSYTANVPRPLVQFGQYLYFGNGTNLGQIVAGATVGSYSVLSPAFPIGTYVRDLDVNPEGTYVQIIVSRINSPDLTSTTQDTNSLSSSDSYLISWDGVLDTNNTGKYSTFYSFNSYSINSNISFGQNGYTTGYDLGGAAIYSGANKIISLPNSLSPNFSAMFATGNMLGFASPENNSSVLKSSIMMYGAYDKEIPEGLYRFLRTSSTSPETDVIQMPLCTIVSNLFYGSSSAGYTNNLVGAAKLYYSTLETSSAPTTKYRLYKFNMFPTGSGTAMGGVYETQTQLFSKKVKIGECRFYTEPLVTNNSFKVDLIGSDGGVISGSSKTFTVGSTATAGNDYAWYTPQCTPTYAIGLRVTNLGSANFVMTKAEIDYSQAGK